MMSRILGSLAFLGGILWGASLASGATNISKSPDRQSWAPRITLDSQDNIYVIWIEESSETSGDIYFVKFLKSDPQWSEPENISNSGRVFRYSKENCGLDSDNYGRVYAVWGESGGVKIRILTNGVWGAVENVASSNNVVSVRVAVSPDGDVFVAWWTDDGSDYSRARVGGAWEAIRMISAKGQRGKYPDIAVGNDRVMACWVEKGASDYRAVYVVRSRAAGSAWSSPAPVYPLNYPQQHAVVAFAGGTIPHIICTPVVDPNRFVQHFFWNGSGFSKGQELSDVTMLHYPAIASKQGVIYAAWQEGAYGNGLHISFNVYSNGAWAGTTTVADSYGCTYCDIDADLEGQANIVYDSAGEIFFWSDTGDGGGGEKVNQPPVAEYIFSPLTGIAPLEVLFDAGGSYDPDGRIVQYDWVFGDGGTGLGRQINHIFETKGVFSIQLNVVDDLGLSGTKVKSIEILGLFPPLNVRWQTFTDESLFMSRSVTDVDWEANPANDPIAAIAAYRVYRKATDDDDAVFTRIAELDGSTLTYRDTKVSGPDGYIYAVTAVDAAGHESPKNGDAAASADELDARERIKIREILDGRIRRLRR